MGSKARIAKHILPIMLEEAEKKGITTWVEPFVGGANMIDKVPNTFKRIGYDLNPHTIAALVGIRDHLEELPCEVTKELYNSIKGTEPHNINSWIRYECSFASKLDNGYASNKEGRNYAEKGKNLAIKQSPKIRDVVFICEDYENLYFENSVIYCDPPYQGTTGYKIGSFDHDKFFRWCRKQAENNIVFVSEYDAPDDFDCVWQGEIKTNFSSTRKGATHKAVEKLFKVPN